MSAACDADWLSLPCVYALRWSRRITLSAHVARNISGRLRRRFKIPVENVPVATRLTADFTTVAGPSDRRDTMPARRSKPLVANIRRSDNAISKYYAQA